MKFLYGSCIVAGLVAAVNATALGATGLAAVDVNLLVKPDAAIADNPSAAVRIVVPRGGAGSGQVVVKADAPIRDLQAAVTVLAAKDGSRLPAGAVRVRYGTRQIDLGPNNFKDFPWEKFARPTFDGLSETLVPGESVQPVWVTVNVPADAVPGEYSGTLKLVLPDAQRSVPLTVVVTSFTMPRPGEQRMWVSMSQSPDTLAQRYKVAPWSDEHFKLLEQSFRLEGQLGNCVLYVPVITQTAMGESTGLVYFRKDGSQLVPDFTAFDRCVELYKKHCGTPRALILNVWDPRFVDDFGTKTPAQVHLSVAKGDGTFETASLPVYAADQKPMWKALFAGAVERAARAGIAKEAILLGTASDWTPLKEHFAFFKELEPGLRWAVFTHGYGGTGGYGAYIEVPDGPVNHGRGSDTQKPDWFLRGTGVKALEKDKAVKLNTQRDCHDDLVAPWIFRMLHDGSIDNACGISGLARVGLDFWLVPASDQEGEKCKADRKYRPRTWFAIGRYGSNYGRLYRHATWSMTLPGPTGPLSTARLEAMREGFQQAEARLACEAAIASGKLSAADRETCRSAVRGIYEMEYVVSGKGGKGRREPSADWQDTVRKLYEAAAVAQATAKLPPERQSFRGLREEANLALNMGDRLTQMPLSLDWLGRIARTYATAGQLAGTPSVGLWTHPPK